MTILLFILCGLITGLLSGMLGIGGGVITVPVLYFFFYYTAALDAKIMQVATSTSLAIGFLTSLLSSIIQYSRGAILFLALRKIALGLAMGCICGALLAHFVSSELLRHIFGIGLCFIGIYFAIPRLPNLHIASSPNGTLSFFGYIIGTLSSLLGIGGGILTFPTFLGYNMKANAASATASCTTTLSCFIGTTTYLIIAWKDPRLTSTFGYVNLQAFLTIGLTALITTPLGVKLSHTLDTRLIKQVFGICLSLIGLTMLFLS
jgi:uncharacterized membrane protein YfcA